MNHRREGAYWYSTKQTAMVIYGMIEYLKASNELNSSVAATVFLNGQKMDAPYSLDEAKLAPGENKVKIVTSMPAGSGGDEPSDAGAPRSRSGAAPGPSGSSEAAGTKIQLILLPRLT